MPTAAVTLSLSGRFARQGAHAAAGLRLWAAAAGVRLLLVDDGGAGQWARRAYAGWLGDRDVELLLGPYGSGLVRAVAPLVCGAGRLLWNHGGSSDELARAGLVSLPAPASSYFYGVVDHAAGRAERLLVVHGPGRFARAVAAGATARAAARRVDAHAVPLGAPVAADGAAVAVLVAGSFDQDVALVRQLRRGPRPPALLAAVAAGLPAFGAELGDAAEGVLGPVQWWPSPDQPQVGPSGTDFAARYRSTHHAEPSYVAAQAAAAGYLAHAAHALGLAADQVRGWATSSLLGRFALDAGWRQVGHRVTTIAWRGGRMTPLAGGATGRAGVGLQ